MILQKFFGSLTKFLLQLQCFFPRCVFVCSTPERSILFLSSFGAKASLQEAFLEASGKIEDETHRAKALGVAGLVVGWIVGMIGWILLVGFGREVKILALGEGNVWELQCISCFVGGFCWVVLF